jgi:flagellar biosynthetic protein FlhB
MTPREVREERASYEGKPEVKARRRSVAARRGRSLRIAALKRATAVVTNPTHIAVALRYAPPAIDVPLVVSAGKDLAAMLLRGAAEDAGVPIVESPDLARALYARVDVDEPIPEELYIAVAAVFAWILKTRGALRGADPP